MNSGLSYSGLSSHAAFILDRIISVEEAVSWALGVDSFVEMGMGGTVFISFNDGDTEYFRSVESALTFYGSMSRIFS